MEMGPCLVNLAGDRTTFNKYSWNNNATMIFLDQPTNVGYSYGYPDTSDSFAAARDVYVFLQLFFKQFPSYAKLDFHIAGESCKQLFIACERLILEGHSDAGHYIPAVASIIQQNNKVADKVSLPINLKSLIIGNGLTDPLIQYKSFGSVGCNGRNARILSADTCASMDKALPKCLASIDKCYRTVTKNDCVAASTFCNFQLVKPYMDTGLNPYDINKLCSGGSLCYDILYSVQKYLNRPEIVKAVGAHIKNFKSCNTDVNHDFQAAGDWMRPYVRLLPDLLNNGIRLLVYAGDNDFVCNWVGNKAWTLELQWDGQQEYNTSNDKTWLSRSRAEAGEMRTSKDGRLTFLRVYKAGHMVPYDQPEYALDMVNQWMQGGLH
ncbi:hypothetical protein EC973_006680 [Apophysomyces ossiformis]|uniref:carboxypeptidase C n=1 Tax=Apophysomyces ossiformis TaxID=679940 RepID=A0A8H7EUH6_9FUNG|nr:hypothetical protein EC973_006680 [Apophysomyces ossiformis]